MFVAWFYRERLTVRDEIASRVLHKKLEKFLCFLCHVKRLDWEEGLEISVS